MLFSESLKVIYIKEIVLKIKGIVVVIYREVRMVTLIDVHCRLESDETSKNRVKLSVLL